MTDSTPYEEHVLGAADTCSNCLSVIARERDQRESTDSKSVTSVRLSPHTRIEPATSIEYVGLGHRPAQSKGVFCECGVESPRERIWSSKDIDRERFRELLKNVLRTLADKGGTVKPKETAAYALQAFDDGDGPDAALAEAIDAGIVAAAASDASGDQLRADGGTRRDTEL